LVEVEEGVPDAVAGAADAGLPVGESGAIWNKISRQSPKLRPNHGLPDSKGSASGESLYTTRTTG